MGHGVWHKNNYRYVPALSSGQNREAWWDEGLNKKGFRCEWVWQEWRTGVELKKSPSSLKAAKVNISVLLDLCLHKITSSKTNFSECHGLGFTDTLHQESEFIFDSFLNYVNRFPSDKSVKLQRHYKDWWSKEEALELRKNDKGCEFLCQFHLSDILVVLVCIYWWICLKQRGGKAWVWNVHKNWWWGTNLFFNLKHNRKASHTLAMKFYWS